MRGDELAAPPVEHCALPAVQRSSWTPDAAHGEATPFQDERYGAGVNVSTFRPVFLLSVGTVAD
jgi:hypothetical protein